MSPVAEFGSLVLETDVDEAVSRTLRLWVPTYLSRFEEERNFSNRHFARPKEYQTTLEDDSFPDKILPSILVTTARTEDLAKDGNGVYLVSFHVVVTAVARGRSPSDARLNASVYGGAARRLLVQHEGLGGFASGVNWASSRLAPVDVSGSNRNLAASINEFNVYVDQVLDSGVGPLLPDPVYDDPDPVNAPNVPYQHPIPGQAPVTEVGVLIVDQSPGSS